MLDESVKTKRTMMPKPRREEEDKILRFQEKNSNLEFIRLPESRIPVQVRIPLVKSKL